MSYLNKPSWNDAPDWANYLAMDEDGEWFWYADEPDCSSPSMWWSVSGNYQKASEPTDWRASKEQKPS